MCWENVASFEAEWAEFCGSRYAVGVGNGLDALTLTSDGPGTKGDEVIVPSSLLSQLGLPLAKLAQNQSPSTVTKILLISTQR